MMREKILRKVKNSEELPTPSAVGLKVMKMALEEDVSMNALSEEIAKDVSLTSRVLRVVNSRYYGLSREVTTLKQAVVILGVQAVRNLALATSVIDVMEGKEDELLHRVMETALCSAVASRYLCNRLSPDSGMAEEAFAAGLLADIGIYILLHEFPSQYSKVLRESEKHAIDLRMVEQDQLGIDHVETGQVMVSRWNLPNTIVIPLTYHHHTDGYPGRFDERIHILCRFTHMGSLVGEIFYGWRKSHLISLLQEELKKHFDINPSQTKKFLEEIGNEVNEAAKGFQIPGVTVRNYTEILNEANKELGRMNVEYDGMYRELKTLVEELENKNRQLDKLTAELAERNRMLQLLADRDGLTGLFNHRFFKEFLEKKIYEHKRYGKPLSLIMMDIDHFKKFNDTMGHRAGDAVLKEVARLVMMNTRKADLCARYGGEEFVVLLADTHLRGATAAAEKIRRVVETYSFIYENKSGIHVTLSLGVSTLDDTMKHGSELVERADKALYSAKENGRNQVRVMVPASGN